LKNNFIKINEHHKHNTKSTNWSTNIKERS
jgi:hypothetical protein